MIGNPDAPILISSGEPAGIGPDLCLALSALDLPLVVLGDKHVLAERARKIGIDIELLDYTPGRSCSVQSQQLMVLSLPAHVPVEIGVLNPKNSPYVLQMLEEAAMRCMAGEFLALVTAPVHKAVISAAGIPFTGHTEFLATYCQVPSVVMLLACRSLKVALVTTHLPLSEVSAAIDQALLTRVLMSLHHALQQDFAIPNPKIYVAGLNPHAGESGFLGREEIDVIEPVLCELRRLGLNLQGPFPADTMFLMQETAPCDAFLAMYHDQGLPVLKFAGFGDAVNISLGLPIIRTSVDHGTALELAGTGRAKPDSLFAAVHLARTMALNRANHLKGTVLT